MAGASFKAEIRDEDVQRDLQRIMRNMGTTVPAMKDAGEYMQRSVSDRFRKEEDPEGRPWEPLSPFTLANKRNDKILTERGGPGLRGSIHYRAGEGVLEQGTNKIYGAVHQFGATIKPKSGKSLAIGSPKGRFALVGSVTIPARPYLGVSDEDRERIREIVLRHALSGTRFGKSR